MNTRGWSVSAKRNHDPTTPKFWKWVSFVVLCFCRCRLNSCAIRCYSKTDIPIRLFSIDSEHILQYTGFSNVRPAPPAWSRDVCWEWLPVTEWAAVRGGGDLGLLKAQFGATRAFLYTHCCYVIHSTSRLATSGDFFLSLLLFKKLDPNGSCGPHLKTRDVQKVVTSWLLFALQPGGSSHSNLYLCHTNRIIRNVFIFKTVFSPLKIYEGMRLRGFVFELATKIHGEVSF